jgi:hypothetical protein
VALVSARATAMTTVAEVLDLVAPRLGPLATADAVARLRAPDVTSLPILSGLLLECALTMPDAGAAVGVAMRAHGHRDDDALLALAERYDGPAWRGVAGLVAARRADAHLATAFPELWIELDLDRPDDAVAPSVFAKVDDYYGRPPTLGDAVAPRRAASVSTLSAALTAAGVDLAGASALLDRALDAMPASAGLSYVGAMLGRDVPTARLTIERMPLGGQAQVFLRRTGWDPPGGQDALREVLEKLADYARTGVLHVDLTAGPQGAVPGERIGIEISGDVARDPDFRSMVVGDRLADQAALDALDAWPFRWHHGVTDVAWPAGLRHHTVLAGGVNHLKVVLDPAWRVSIKAYLSVVWGSGLPLPSSWGGD